MDPVQFTFMFVVANKRLYAAAPEGTLILRKGVYASPFSDRFIGTVAEEGAALAMSSTGTFAIISSPQSKTFERVNFTQFKSEPIWGRPMCYDGIRKSTCVCRHGFRGRYCDEFRFKI